MYSPLTEENKDVELVEHVVGARPLTVINFIEDVPTVLTPGLRTFSFSSQIKGLPLYQPDCEDMNEYDFFQSQSTPMIIR